MMALALIMLLSGCTVGAPVFGPVFYFIFGACFMVAGLRGCATDWAAEYSQVKAEVAADTVVEWTEVELDDIEMPVEEAEFVSYLNARLAERQWRNELREGKFPALANLPVIGMMAVAR